MNLVPYYRLSKESKTKANLGLDAQQNDVVTFCQTVKDKDPVILKAFTEIETGTRKKKRPEMARAIEYCKANDATLVIAKLDRLARQVAFIANLMESKVNFIALDIPDATPFTIHIYAAIAENEAKTISARTSAALQVKIRQGIKIGVKGVENLTSAKAKARVHHYQVIRKQEAKEFAEKTYPAIEHFQRKGFTLPKIAQELNKLKHVTPSGLVGKWTTTTVSRCLKMVA